MKNIKNKYGIRCYYRSGEGELDAGQGHRFARDGRCDFGPVRRDPCVYPNDEYNLYNILTILLHDLLIKRRIYN